MCGLCGVDCELGAIVGSVEFGQFIALKHRTFVVEGGMLCVQAGGRNSCVFGDTVHTLKSGQMSRATGITVGTSGDLMVATTVTARQRFGTYDRGTRDASAF